MSISTILDNKETTAAEKLTALSEVITKARKAYGNTELEITVPVVGTTEGAQPMVILSSEDN